MNELTDTVMDAYEAFTNKAKREAQKTAVAAMWNAHMLTGAQAKHIRENELKLGVSELAHMLGLSRGTVHNWELAGDVPLKLWYALGIHYLLVATE